MLSRRIISSTLILGMCLSMTACAASGGKDAWNELYEAAGIHVEALYQTSEDASAKLKEMVMTGEYPDIFYVDLNTYIDFVQQGLVADITEYFKGEHPSGFEIKASLRRCPLPFRVLTKLFYCSRIIVYSTAIE